MSREWMLKRLEGLGLSPIEAEVYLFLTKAGPLRGRDIAAELKLYKQLLYRCLKGLKCKGCVKGTLERPAMFSAMPLENVLESFMEAKMEQAKGLKKNRDELLEYWHSIIKKNSNKSPAATKP